MRASSRLSQLRGGLGLVRMGGWAFRRAAGMPADARWAGFTCRGRESRAQLLWPGGPGCAQCCACGLRLGEERRAACFTINCGRPFSLSVPLYSSVPYALDPTAAECCTCTGRHVL